jgi:hypothetical protein
VQVGGDHAATDEKHRQSLSLSNDLHAAHRVRALMPSLGQPWSD